MHLEVLIFRPESMIDGEPKVVVQTLEKELARNGLAEVSYVKSDDEVH